MKIQTLIQLLSFTLFFQAQSFAQSSVGFITGTVTHLNLAYNADGGQACAFALLSGGRSMAFVTSAYECASNPWLNSAYKYGLMVEIDEMQTAGLDLNSLRREEAIGALNQIADQYLMLNTLSGSSLYSE